MTNKKASFYACLQLLKKPINVVVAVCLMWTFSGCQSTGGGAMTKVWQQVKSPFNATSVAGAKSDKKPDTVQLSYAKWQEELGNIIEAQQSYEKVLKANPRSVDATIGLARIDQLAGKKYKAQKGYQKALQLNPHDPQALDAMGQFYASQQRWNDAVDMLNKAMLAGPREPLYRFHLAVAMTKQGDTQGALPHFSKTVGEAEGHFNIGKILLSEGKIPVASEQFQLALAKKPSMVEAQQVLQELQNQYPESIKLAGANRFPKGHSTTANIEQSRNQRNYQTNHINQQERPYSAPVITPARQVPVIQPASHSGHNAGHSTFPASLEKATRGMVTPSDFSNRATPQETNNNGLSSAQREQLRNQFHSQR